MAIFGFDLSHTINGLSLNLPINAQAIFVQITRMQFFDNHLTPVMLAFIGKLLLSTQINIHVPGF